MCKKETRNYYTVQELMAEALKRAEADERYAELEQACALDYQMVSSGNGMRLLKRLDFDVIGTVTYGGSEGIYGSLYASGEWLPAEEQSVYGQHMPIYTIKTLRDDKDAYLAVGALATILSYYANEVIIHNMDRFD